MNKKRKAIWDKSGGKCWYCGCDLPRKGWHADHFEPLGRQPSLEIYDLHEDQNGNIRATTIEQKREPLYPDRDNENNKVPACASCNIMKGMGSVDDFRRTIEKFINSLNNYSNQYKFAKRYGLVVETEKPVVFWFEKQGLNEDQNQLTIYELLDK